MKTQITVVSPKHSGGEYSSPKAPLDGDTQQMSGKVGLDDGGGARRLGDDVTHQWQVAGGGLWW